MRTLCIWLLTLVTLAAAEPGKKPNILFIPIDDLNHWVGFLGRNPQAKTPNIDRLAKLGVAFSQAYCTAPSCNPSRASLMSGLRPSSTGCYENDQNWRSGISEDKLLNSHLAKNGYAVFGAGKIYHGAGDRGGHFDEYFAGKGGPMRLHPEAKDDGVGGIKFAPLAGTDEEMADHGVVTWCIEKMSRKHDKPWFIAAGLVKPHMPWNVPKKWFDLFPLDQIQLPPHAEDDLGDVPAAGVKIAKPSGDHAAILKSGRWKEAVQAYLATIAYCDYEVGRLIAAWEKSPEKDNTIICLWSDHGWSLGEKEHWRKFALWEEPTRTVFIWKAPGVTAPGGLCARPVDYASIYPTLCALAGIPAPAHLEGADITALLRDPKAEWKLPAVTTWMKGNHAVRSEDWRYIRYADGSEELYHNSSDPLEHVNLAGKSDLSANKAELAKFLPQKDAANLPRGKGGEGEEAEGAKPAKKGKGKGKKSAA